MVITDKDIQKLKSVFATKDDLKNFSTKNESKKFATKNDLKRFATKEDLKRFATKEDLDKLEIRTGQSFIEVKERIDGLEDQFKDLKSEVLRMEDHIIKEIKSMQLDLQVATSHRRELDNHETRITKLERNLSLA